jgi:two-component system KDP operon response regulator KdpE
MHKVTRPVEPSRSTVLIEDQKLARCHVKAALELDGLVVFDVKTAQRGLKETASRKPDLIILDIDLPAGDGINFIRNIRDWSEIPIIVFSACATETGKIEVLDAGADDYLTKPFGMGELLARARSQLRRYANVDTNSRSEVMFGAVHVDFVQRLVTRDGVSVKLTPIEYRLLTLLIFNERKVLTHRRILAEIWGPEQSGKNHYLRIYIGGLRRKLESDTAHPRHILTEAGIGYRFII